MESPESIDSHEYTPSFVFTLNIPTVKLKKAYKVTAIPLEQRKTLYVSRLSIEAQSAWQWIEAQAKEQAVQVFPWDIKATWRKLALKMHPDQSTDQGAKENFIVLKQKIAILTNATADACI